VSSVAVRRVAPRRSERRDTEPVARLFAVYSDRLLRFCQLRLGDRSDAEDAVQTTFLCAHRALQRGVVPESEAAWLFTIAKNVCRWQQRTSSRRATISRDLDVEALAQPEGVGEEDGDLLRELDAALAAIPERQRRALLLREWRGLSCPEIASRLDMSAPATHALLTRARRSLASALTATRPVVCLDFGALLLQFRRLLLGTSAKVATTTVVAVGVGVGGVSFERSLDTDGPLQSTPVPALVGAGNDEGRSKASYQLQGVLVRTSAHSAPLRPAQPAVNGPGGHGSTGQRVEAVLPHGRKVGDATGATTSSGSASPVPERSQPLKTVPVPDPALVPELSVELPPVPEIEPPPEVPPPDAEVPPLPDLPGTPDVELSLPAPLPDVSVTGLPDLLP
jgi:RNA polymerase sigma factor (sigma-70 family)